MHLQKPLELGGHGRKNAEPKMALAHHRQANVPFRADCLVVPIVQRSRGSRMAEEMSPMDSFEATFSMMTTLAPPSFTKGKVSKAWRAPRAGWVLGSLPDYDQPSLLAESEVQLR